jgi:hypothetical protein
VREAREARAETLRGRAAKAREKSSEAYKAAFAMADQIPLGQPILVGHHSEKRDWSYREKIASKYGKAAQLAALAGALDRMADSAERDTTIYADNLDPVGELDAKIAKLEAQRENIKAHNREQKRKGLPVAPAYKLANLGAEIRRNKTRRDQVAAIKARKYVETKFSEVTVIEDPELARVMIVFPGKPPPAILSRLRSSGFHWAPSKGSWMRQLSSGAVALAKQIAKGATE